MNHHNIGSKSDGLFEFILLHVGSVAFVKQRGARFSEVADRVLFAEQQLQLSRVGFGFPVLERITISNAIACTSHFDGLRLKHRGKNQRQEQYQFTFHFLAFK